MATRAASVPPVLARPAVSARWRERVALPVVALLVVLAGLAQLGSALGDLPSTAGAPDRSADLAALAAARQSPGSIDAFTQTPGTAWPRSTHPVGGMAFVRCTNLWTAHADGSNARRIVSMPGIASPTFSPDGRTIAFLAAGSIGTELWMAAADGSTSRRLGTLSEDGIPIRAPVGPLEWSPDGTRLSVSIAPAGIRSAPVTHWILTLETGRFELVGEGGDEPTWLERQILTAGRSDGRVDKLWGNGWTAKRLSKAGDVESIAFAPGWWAWRWEKQTAILVHDARGELRLAWRKGPYRNRTPVETAPPPGYRFDVTARIAVLQHGPVAVTLVDESGGRDLGLFDPQTRRWNVLEYAWDASWSPAPAAVGGLEERRAVELVRNLLWSLRRPERTGLLLERPLGDGLASFAHLGYALGEPSELGGAWSIPAFTYGRATSGFATQDLDLQVRSVDGRLAASVARTGPIVRLRSVDDAVRYLDRVLSVRVIAPAGLPEETRVGGIDAWSWGGRTTGSLHVAAPGLGRLTFYFGEGGLGCGSYPVPVELTTGTPAIVQDPEMSGGYNAIVWPARPNASSGPFGIRGEVPPTTLIAIANAMDARRTSG